MPPRRGRHGARGRLKTWPNAEKAIISPNRLANTTRARQAGRLRRRWTGPLAINIRHPIINLKLHAVTSKSLNTFTGYGDGYVEINANRFEQSVLVMPEGQVNAWPVSSFSEISTVHLGQILELAPEVVVFGSGRVLRFLPPALLRPFFDRRIGVETMDLYAACRTYNILMTEGRKVAAAILIDTIASAK